MEHAIWWKLCAHIFSLLLLLLCSVFFLLNFTSMFHTYFIWIVCIGNDRLLIQAIYVYIYAENGHHSVHRKLQLICKYYILLTVQTSLARVTYIPKLFLPSSRIIVYDFVYFFFCSIRRRYCCCWWCFFIIYLIMCLSWSETGGPPNNYYVITQYLSFTINYERTMAKQKPS